ncbi:hypothetical protein [Bacillus sp. T33-2]|uniref:hypothetical protein n=1 Tax=Bacillus sp. T33-2 TaxID=2054168 RepID=UPI000C77D9AD|nr:hypothetical protein [Bacillus sp. T33-2]PLR99738.1 hypothetical protein CVD19_01385 [Bacillus sp. T33-2]
MAYIIENAQLLKDGVSSLSSLMIDKDKILFVSDGFKMYKHMRMDASGFIMTPPHVLLDASVPVDKPFQVRKSYYLNEFILKGCTAFLTYVALTHENQLPMRIKQMRAELVDCPVDYIIGVKIRAPLLTQAFLRKCKKEKVPAVFVEISDLDELRKIPWGWLREAMFPYNSPLVPMFLWTKNNKEKRQAAGFWKGIMKAEKIPSIFDEIRQNEPLKKSVLMKTGIFPRKSHLHNGGEISYNFYLKSNETVKANEKELFFGHQASLAVTVHKGNVVRAGGQVFYRPGTGENVQIRTPAFFVAN